MTARARAPGRLSKVEHDVDISALRSEHRWFFPVLVELKRTFPRKFAEQVAAIAGRSERICDVWKTGRGVPDGEALAALLNSDIGDRLLLALTKGSLHAWRKRLNRQIEISQLRDQQRETARRLEALERGDA